MEEEKAAVEAEFNKLLCRLIIAANDLGAIDYAADNRQAYSREEAEIKQHGLQISVSEEYVSLLSANARLEAENVRILGIINYLKMHIEYVMGDNENAIPEKFWLNAMKMFIEKETSALSPSDESEVSDD